MQFNLVKAHDETYDPYRIGINFRRLGISNQKMLASYCRGAYPESWFEALQKGYDTNDLVSDSPTVQIDTDYVFRNLVVANPIFKNFHLLGTKRYESEGDSYFINGQGFTHYCVLHHKTLALMVVVSYHMTYYTDGSHSAHWSLKFSFDTNNASRFHYAKNYHVRDPKADLHWISCGCSMHGKDHHQVSLEDRSSGPIAHTSKVAIVILKFIRRVEELGLVLQQGRVSQKPFINFYTQELTQEEFWAEFKPV